jgi:uncharacterized protein (TIRG00374 family)
MTRALHLRYRQRVGAVSKSASAKAAPAPRRNPAVWGRIAFLVVTAICFYVFAPSLGEVFEAWDRLGEIHPFAVLAVLGVEFLSFVCVWILQRIALQSSEWFSIATTQLAGNAFNRITPGGGSTGTALQVRMLRDAGFPTASTATAITVQSILVSGAVLAMPIVCIPLVLFAGLDIPGDLADGAWIGAGVFVLLLALGALFFGSRTAACKLGGAIETVGNAFPRKTPLVGLGEKLLKERDQVRERLGARWPTALSVAVGRWGFEYFALLITLYAIGADPNPWLVLLAFVFASVLTMIPFTPGGLGFVEAGLTGALALAGIHAAEAVLATLVFRLVTFWLPIPVGGLAAILFRRRYPRGGATARQAALEDAYVTVSEDVTPPPRTG